jgi:hypothetical protein
MLLRSSGAREARHALHGLSLRFLSRRALTGADPSLSTGSAGLALVSAALDAAFPGEGHDAAAQRALGRAARNLSAVGHSPSFYDGFTGVAWVIEVLTGNPELPPERDPNAAVDAALVAYLSQTPWTRPYDAVRGLVGIGIYALERLPRASGEELLSLVVDRLAEALRPRDPGIAWWTDPAWGSGGPGWNLGLAHGVPGVVALLSNVVTSGARPETVGEARRLIEGAVTWLLAQELPDHAGGAFSFEAGPPETAAPARLGWCYGDTSVATALLAAARATRDTSWEKAAVRVALRATERPFETSGVEDAGLCHGAAGVAHMFHRMHTTTRDERFARAARTWFDRALGMREERGFCGFRAARRSPGGTKWHPEPGFITGAGGVTLALLAATTGVEPTWDRALLLS